MGRKATWALAGALVALVAALAWFLWPSGGPPAPAPPSGWPQRTVTDDGAGEVTVSATREAAAADASALTFRVTLDTHTVDLTGYDAVAHSRLEDAGGNRIPPGAGSATTEPGSHHQEATLVFARPATDRMFLVIRDLGGVPERRLEFVP